MAQGRDTPSSSGSRVTQRIPILTTGHVNAFATDTISNYAGLLRNGIIDYYSNDKERPYITQRPGTIIVHQASATVVDALGRGIHYWSSNSNTYWMNDDVVYKNDYSTPCTVQVGDTAIANGSDKVYFLEWSSANADYLFIFDPENDGIYVISSEADTTIINITDRSGAGTLEGFAVGDPWNFDTLNAVLALGLAHGAVALDGYVFIATTTARIYNSENDDWLIWSGDNFTTAERESDSILFLGKSKDNIVAFGDRTIELYYDNGTSPGTPLAARKDVTYQTGTAFAQTVWNSGDDIHFLAVKPSGEFELSTLRNFEIVPHTNSTMNSFLWQTRYTQDLDYIMHGYTMGGHTYVILTVYDAGTVVITYVYDEAMDVWMEWDTTIGSNTGYALMGLSVRQATNIDRPFGIMRNGDIMRVDASLLPVDKIQDGATENITMVAITDNFDAATSDSKFMHSAQYVGSQPIATASMDVEWTDDNGVTSNSSSIDLLNRTRINRMGKFVNRKFTFTCTISSIIRLEGVDVTFTQGST